MYSTEITTEQLALNEALKIYAFDGPMQSPTQFRWLYRMNINFALNKMVLCHLLVFARFFMLCVDYLINIAN